MTSKTGGAKILSKMADDLSANLSYKELQELFVSNLNGTSLWEIASVVSSAPVAVLLRTSLVGFLSIFNQTTWSKKALFIGTLCLVDFATLVLPVLLSFTVFADHATVLNLTILCLAFGFLLTSKLSKNHRESKPVATHWSEVLNSVTPGKQPFIGNFRAYVVIATAIGILAVDFVIFPRRFAKAETYGAGLMDVGVGAFVISNSIVAPEARGVDTRKDNLLRSILKSVQSAVPILILGFLRLAAVKSTDYQEHVSEYGTHWNFFFTLFVVRVLSTILVRLIPGSRWFGLVGLLLACLYEFLLSSAGLQSFILHGSKGDGTRSGLLDANREGLCSCVGYLALYLIGLQLGRFLFCKRVTLNSWLYALLFLIVIDATFWCLTAVSSTLVSPVSRRMANLSFVLWQVAYNIQLLSSFLFCDVFMTFVQRYFSLETVPPSGGCPGCYPRTSEVNQTPCACLIAAVNRNQLVYFLLANLLTGLVNFLFQTLYCGSAKGFVIVTCYLFVLNSLALVLHLKGVTLKFK